MKDYLIAAFYTLLILGAGAGFIALMVFFPYLILAIIIVVSAVVVIWSTFMMVLLSVQDSRQASKNISDALGITAMQEETNRQLKELKDIK